MTVTEKSAPAKTTAPMDLTSTGLTSEEAKRRLEQSGPNAMPDTTLHPLARAIAQLWAPVPGMLELAIVIEIALGRYVEGAIVAVLLGANAGLGFFQEGRAQATLAAG
jgi:H+-transporting ATPase